MLQGTDFDEVLDALEHRYRRRLLAQVLASNPVDTADLEAVVEPGGTAAQDAGQPTDVVVAMYHRHLPKLAAAGYIEWNQEHGEITKGEEWPSIAPILELLVDHEAELPFQWR